MRTKLVDPPLSTHQPAVGVTDPVPQAGPWEQPDGDVAIDVTGLVKTYGGKRVVDDVGFRVRRGEIFGLLGANGAGKTTTVECLQGLRRPDAGHVSVLGLDPIRDRARLRAVVGSQLQDAALPDRLRVGEAVALFDRSATGNAVDHLRRWGLQDKAKTCFADLSGGQRQRLFIVLALLNDPRIVFLDELTQGLDPAARRDVWQAIGEVRDRGRTVVLVSHFAEEIEALCDRVAVLADGRVVDTGTPKEVTDRHASLTTVAFTRPEHLDPDTVAALERRPDITSVVADRHRLTMTGTSTMVGAVCAATVDGQGISPADLRVTHASLDDALINLIGAPS